MRRILLAATCIAPLAITPAQAAMVVEDFGVFGQAFEEVKNTLQMLKDNTEFLTDWIDQLEKMEEEINQTKAVLKSLTNIPEDLISSVSELIGSVIQNPLDDINLNMHNMMYHSGHGSCANASSIRSMSTYHSATGRDLNAAWINGTTSRLSGVIACTERLLNSTEERLRALPKLLNKLSACTDTSCTTAMTARASFELANIAALHQQSSLVSQQEQNYQAMTNVQKEQKQRADAEEVSTATSGWNGGGSTDTSGTVTSSADVPTFSASTSP